MKDFPKVSLVGSGLAIANLCLTFFVWSREFEGSWGGFLLFIFNFPVSMLSLIPVGWNPWVFFSIVGPLWWYAVGAITERIWLRRRN